MSRRTRSILISRPSASLACLASSTLLALSGAAAHAETITIPILSGPMTGRVPSHQNITNLNQNPSAQQFTESRTGVQGIPYTIPANPGWLQSIAGSTATWLSGSPTGNSTTAPNSIIAVPFDVPLRRIGNVSLQFTYAADDQLGSPTCAGIWIGAEGQMPTAVPGTNGIGNYWQSSTFSAANVTGVASGRNYIYFVVNDTGGGPGGVIFSGSVSITRGAGDIIINTDAGTISNDGDTSDAAFLGVPFTTRDVSGITEFRVFGDVSVPAGNVVSVIGSKPVRLVIGGNLDLPSGTGLSVSAIGPNACAGGGAGGIPGAPVDGIGFGGPWVSATAAGGNGGGYNNCLFGNGGPGAAGAAAYINVRSESARGFAGNSGSAGGAAFGGSVGGLGGNPGQSGVSGSTAEITVAAAGGAGGAGGYSSGSDGQPGAGGAWGGNGGDGATGNPGVVGTIGQNLASANSSVLSAGGGGGGGGSGGTGAGGYSGYQGAAGGGGGGGGATSCAGGGNGGGGGWGGRGGSGGNGGTSGAGGLGGGGGGLLDVLVLGKLTGAGSITAAGGTGASGVGGRLGLVGSPGEAGGGGYNGGYGGAAYTGVGGHGGPGGTGGTGGRGGWGGPGAAGGAGAGGTIRLQWGSNASSWGISAGTGGAVSYPSPLVGANAHTGGSTSYIPGLVDGPAPFGMLSTTGALSYFPSRPSSAIMGFMRLAAPPAGFPTFSGYDYCIVANLSASPLSSPTVGIGVSPTALKRGGRDADANLGTAFTTITSLPAGSVWVTLVPNSGPARTVGLSCVLGTGVIGSGTASVGTAIYVSAPPLTRLFVDTTVPAGAPGNSWGNAFKDLQTAISAAASLPTLTEISVAGGIYTPDVGTGQTAGSTASTFALPPGVTIRGGYAGRSLSSSPDSRDPSLYRTVLSADLNKDDDAYLAFPAFFQGGTPTSLTGNHSFTISLWLKYAPTSQAVVVLDSGPYKLVLNPDGSLSSGFYGSTSNSIPLTGMANKWFHIATTYDSTTRVLRSYVNGELKDTDTSSIVPSVGGGLRLGWTDETFSDSIFSGGMRHIRLWDNARSQAQIVYELSGPSTGTEPGLLAYYPLSAFTGTTIPDLAAADGFNNIPVNPTYPNAGTQVAGNRADNATIVATINFSSASAFLSAVQLSDATVAAVNLAGSNASLTIDDALISRNSGQNVIAANTAGDFLTITDTTFTGNNNNGRVIRSTATTNIDRCAFINTNSQGVINQFGGATGTIANTLMSNAGWGNLINADGSPLTLTNCTIVGTTAATALTAMQNAGTIALRNCILSNNASPVDAATTVQYSMLQQSMPGTGNIVATPIFANAAALDFRLATNSPGVDAGNSALVPTGTTLDLAGALRIADVTSRADTGVGCPVVDMGAYETAGIQPVAPTITQGPASVSKHVGETVTLTATVTGGTPAPTFSWTFNGAPISSGPSAGGGVITISGATLTITNAGEADTGAYVLIASSACQVATSAPAQVAITPVPFCPADFNHSGAADVQDIFDYLTAWFAGAPGADFNGVDGINVQDIFDFLAAWFAGC